MKNNSYAEQIKNSEKILDGVKNHQDELIEKGLTNETFIKRFEDRLKETIELKRTQKKKQAEAIDATEQLNQNMDDLHKTGQMLKDIVRKFVDKNQWSSFGIEYRQRKSKSGD